MFTADQAFWMAVAVGVVGIGLGFLIAASFRSSRRSRPSVEEMADPAYNPALDDTERTLRDALGAEADALADFWESREDSR